MVAGADSIEDRRTGSRRSGHKGWCSVLRLYGPLNPWFDKTWQPGEIDLVSDNTA
jgi:hypothetical protein